MTTLERQMQEVLNDIQAICQSASLEINPAKARSRATESSLEEHAGGTCVLSLSKLCPSPAQLRYDNQLIPNAEMLTHLDITLDRRFAFNPHIAKVVTRCIRALGTLKMVQKKGVN